ncbi:kinase-like domain-containing protein, partial [Tanacetum coccineum]
MSSTEPPSHSDPSRIPLEDIIQATNNFAEENIIEKNYNSTVYKGELSGKKLAFVYLPGLYRYMIDSNRLYMFSSIPEHQNIVSFVGFGYKDEKLIIVVEHPTRGGLEKYVSSANLTWLMRVKICLDIAYGLHYFQNHRETHKMKIEDLNSASIHLDENWQAKIQLITPSALIDTAARTLSAVHQLVTPTVYRGQWYNVDISVVDKGRVGYVDPLYTQTGMQPEINSFGVILFELLCARLAVEEGGTQFLSKLARNHYEKGTLTEIIDPLLRVQMNRDSIAIFSEVAYRCLNPFTRQRMSVVIEQLQKVLKLQQGFEISEIEQ